MVFELNAEKGSPCGTQAEGAVCAKALDHAERAWHISETERKRRWQRVRQKSEVLRGKASLQRGRRGWESSVSSKQRGNF